MDEIINGFTLTCSVCGGKVELLKKDMLLADGFACAHGKCGGEIISIARVFAQSSPKATLEWCERWLGISAEAAAPFRF